MLTVCATAESHATNPTDNVADIPAKIKDDPRFSEDACRFMRQMIGKWFVGGHVADDRRRCWCFCTECNETIAKVIIGTLALGRECKKGGSTGCTECSKKVPRHEGMVTEPEAAEILGTWYGFVATLNERGILKSQMLEAIKKGRKTRHYFRADVEAIKPYLATTQKLIKDGCVEAVDDHLWILERNGDGVFVRSDFGVLTTRIYSLAKGAEGFGQPISRIKEAVKDGSLASRLAYGNSGVGGCVQPVCFHDDLLKFKEANVPAAWEHENETWVCKGKKVPIWMGSAAIADLVGATKVLLGKAAFQLRAEVCEQCKLWSGMFVGGPRSRKPKLRSETITNSERNGTVVSDFTKVDRHGNFTDKKPIKRLHTAVLYDSQQFYELWEKGIDDLVVFARGYVPKDGPGIPVRQVKDELKKEGAGKTRTRRVLRQAGIETVGDVGSPHTYRRTSDGPLPPQKTNRGATKMANALVKRLFNELGRPLLSAEIRLQMKIDRATFKWGAVKRALTRLKCKKFMIKEVGKWPKNFPGIFFRLPSEPGQPERPKMSKEDGRRIIAEYLVAKAEFDNKKATDLAEPAATEKPSATPKVVIKEAETVVWISITEASFVSAINHGVISRAVDAGEIKNNGEKGKGKRKVDSADFARWQLERARKRR